MADDPNTPDDGDEDDAPGAIPTSGADDGDQDQDAFTDQDEDQQALSGDQGQQGGASGPDGQTVPGAAQSGGGNTSELQALVRAVAQYGLKMAQQGGGGPQQGQAQQQPQARSFEDGGPTEDDQGAIPTSQGPQDDDVTGSVPDQQAQPAPGYQQEGPFTPTEEGLNTREKALDKSGLGGAFGQAQHGKIDKARQDYAQKGADPSELSGKPPAFPGGTAPHEVLQQGFAQAGQGLANSSLGSEGLRKWLQGDRAMDPNTVSAITNSIDPDGSLPPVTRKMKAIQYAYQKALTQNQDPRAAMDVGVGMLQHQRKEYDMWRTAAAVKLAGGDMQTAIEAANKAFQAPFGSNVHFAQAGNGLVTATVSGDDGNVEGTFPMQPNTFHSMLAKDGKFDILVQKDPFEFFSGLAQRGAPQPGAVGLSGTTADAGGRQFATNSSNSLTQPHAMPRPPAPLTDAEKLEARSKKIFPTVGQEPERQLWLSQQEGHDKDLKSKENVAQLGNNGRYARTELAETHKDARTDKTLEHQDQRTATVEGARTDRAAARETGRNERFDRGWENRVQAAAIKQAGQNRNDPTAARKTALVKNLLQQYSGDPEGFKKGLATYGLDYDRDFAGTASGQPQATAQAPVRNGQGGGQGGAQAAPKVGEVRKGYKFLGGNAGDKAAWEKVQ